MGYLNEIHRLVLTHFSSENNWVNDIANIIVHPLVSLILTCIIFLGFLYQLYSKRINFIGIIASLALLIMFLGFLMQGDVNILSVILFTVGVIFVIIELFVVGAVIGIIGMILITISIVMLGNNLLLMLGNVIVALILSIIEWVILVKLFKRKFHFWIRSF